MAVVAADRRMQQRHELNHSAEMSAEMSTSVGEQWSGEVWGGQWRQGTSTAVATTDRSPAGMSASGRQAKPRSGQAQASWGGRSRSELGWLSGSFTAGCPKNSVPRVAPRTVSHGLSQEQCPTGCPKNSVPRVVPLTLSVSVFFGGQCQRAADSVSVIFAQPYMSE